jgi:amidophosphoribosyltransferase
MGLVADGFDESSFAGLEGDVAVGHTRYSTAGSTVLANAQPYLVNYHAGPLSVAHNGNLVNADSLREELLREGAIFS